MTSPIQSTLRPFSQVSLSEHERYIAQARLMRAEMVASMMVSGWKAVAGLFRASARPSAPRPAAGESHAA